MVRDESRCGANGRSLLADKAHTRCLALLGVAFLAFANLSTAQTCVKGRHGDLGGMCCGVDGCTACGGYDVILNEDPNDDFTQLADPCSCRYGVGNGCAASIALEVKHYLQESRLDNGKHYQSMPVIFPACNGSVFWVHPTYPTAAPTSVALELKPLVDDFNVVWNSKGASGGSGN